MRPTFRTGRSAGHTILHQDGRLFYRAPNVEAAELLCRALNALAEKGITFPEDLLDHPVRENPPEFRELVEDLKGDAAAIYPNNGLMHEKIYDEGNICSAQKEAYRHSVDHVLYSLLDRDLLRIDPKSFPMTRPTDDDIEEASVKLLKEVLRRGNFMDGLAALVNLMQQWKRKGKIQLVVDRFDVDRITAPIKCETCDGEGAIGPEPCPFCEESGQRQATVDVIKTRLENYNKRYEA